MHKYPMRWGGMSSKSRHGARVRRLDESD